MIEPAAFNRRRRRWLAAFAGLVLFAAAGFWRVESTVHRLDEVVRDNEAQRCVTAWTSRGQIREAITIPGEAIITVSTGADPQRVAEFRAEVDRMIQQTYPDPDCDLDAARRELED